MPHKALPGVRVVEYAQFVSGPYCAKLMADMGAEVVKVEPPEGDTARGWGPFPGDIPHPERSGLYLYNNTNKLGITLDLNRAEDRQTFRDLVNQADVLIEDTHPSLMESLGLGFNSLREGNPRLVMTSITPFGQTGPYRGYKGYYLNMSHASGMGYTCPQVPGDYSILEREPLREGGLIGEYDCGVSAAVATLAAVYLCRSTGVGQHIDVSKQEALLHLARPEMAMWFVSGYREHRADETMASTWGGVHPCKDGNIFLFLVEERAWQSFIDMMGNPEWSKEQRFAADERRNLTPDDVFPLVRPWLAEHTRAEIFHGLQTRRCPAAPLNTIEDVVSDRHLKARHFFVSLNHPEAGILQYPSALAKLSATPVAFDRPAPLLGQHNDEVCAGRPMHRQPEEDTVSADGLAARRAGGLPGRRPLEGVRLTDLCWVWAGPSGTELLAYLGAEVIRVESQSHICLTRRNTPWPWMVPADVNQSTTFNSLNLNKRGITINLTQPKGIELVKRLVAISDVVTDNYAGGMMERFGLDYPALKQVKPDIIAASMSGWGAYGPERDYRAYDPIFAALSGLYELTGYPDGEPSRSDNRGRLDLSSGTSCAMCIIAALDHRSRTGEGQFIDVSEWEAMNCVLGDSYMEYFITGRSPTRVGNRDRVMAPHNCYRCKGEDKWVSIAIATDEEWRAFCKTIGRPEWVDDPRFSDPRSRWQNQEQLDPLVSQWTINFTHYEVTETLQEAGVAAFPSMSREELANDRHLSERGVFVEVPHPETGVQTFLAPPWKLSETPAQIFKHSPLLGEDNEHVFCELLGMPIEEFAILVGEGVIY
ncbi:MAG: CoA transferase [Chloroflexota bacterium]|nr:CoA transferase [Chloroflexota bacterium]